MKKLLSLLVLAGVFFFNTGQLHAQDETATDEVMQEEVMYKKRLLWLKSQL